MEENKDNKTQDEQLTREKEEQALRDQEKAKLWRFVIIIAAILSLISLIVVIASLLSRGNVNHKIEAVDQRRHDDSLKFAGSFSAVYQKLNDHDSKLGQLSDSITLIASSMKGVGIKVDNVDKNVKTTNSEIKKLSNSVYRLSKKIDDQWSNQKNQFVEAFKEQQRKQKIQDSVENANRKTAVENNTVEPNTDYYGTELRNVPQKVETEQQQAPVKKKKHGINCRN